MGNVEAAIRYYSLGKLVHQERVMTCIARKFVSMAVEATQLHCLSNGGGHGGIGSATNPPYGVNVPPSLVVQQGNI